MSAAEFFFVGELSGRERQKNSVPGAKLGLVKNKLQEHA